METIRNKEDVIRKCEESIAYYDCRIRAWENVSRLAKKDGSDFKVFSKNFGNAEIYSPYGLDNKLVVAFRDERGRYQTDYINLAETVDGQFLAIHELIAKYKGWKESAEADLLIADECADYVLRKIEEIREHTKDVSRNGSLYYALCGLIENGKYI